MNVAGKAVAKSHAVREKRRLISRKRSPLMANYFINDSRGRPRTPSISTSRLWLCLFLSCWPRTAISGRVEFSFARAFSVLTAASSPLWNGSGGATISPRRRSLFSSPFPDETFEVPLRWQIQYGRGVGHRSSRQADTGSVFLT